MPPTMFPLVGARHLTWVPPSRSGTMILTPPSLKWDGAACHCSLEGSAGRSFAALSLPSPSFPPTPPDTPANACAQPCRQHSRDILSDCNDSGFALAQAGNASLSLKQERKRLSQSRKKKAFAKTAKAFGKAGNEKRFRRKKDITASRGRKQTLSALA